MNKYILRSLCLTLGLLLACPVYAVAGEIKWQLTWSEDGNLLEKVQVPTGLNGSPSAENWKLVQEGDLLTYSREISDWQTYQTQKDGLPLKVKQANYFYYQKASIQTDQQGVSTWFNQLSEGNSLELTLQVPGLIFASSADENNPPSAVWNLAQATDLYGKGQLMNIVNIDGLLSGITLVGVGLIIGGGIFFRRLRKVDEIIAEEYGFPKHPNNPPNED